MATHCTGQQTQMKLSDPHKRPATVPKHSRNLNAGTGPTLCDPGPWATPPSLRSPETLGLPQAGTGRHEINSGWERELYARLPSAPGT